MSSSGNAVSAEQRQEQLAIIRSEIEAAPLISDPVEPLTNACLLVREFAQNEAFLPKVLSLFAPDSDRPPYRGIRYVRRDGNCFFRCASFALLEHMLSRPELASEFILLFDELRGPLLAHYGNFAQDFCDVAVGTVRQIASRQCATPAQLHAAAIAPDAEYALYFYRYAVSQYIRSHRDDFLPFVLGYNYESVEAFCSAEIDAVASESDHVQLVAFARCFGVRIVVEYLDSSEGNQTTQHKFAGDNAREGLVITLLYRPGHYDLLYT